MGQDRAGMEVTLIAAYLCSDMLHICHVGDVRCYVRDAARLRAVTQDHSVVGLLMRAGQLTPEEARGHPEKGTVLQAIGTPMVLTPEVHSLPLHAGNLVLLCSDGLWEALSDEEVNTILGWQGSCGSGRRS
jgi:serine/threonine protein phosphatase PrpC